MAQKRIVTIPEVEANSGGGTPLATAFQWINENFDELYQDDAGDVNSVTGSGGLTASPTTGAVQVSITDGGVTTAKLADNSVDSDKLNVSGNGTSGQALLSDGDGSFSWGSAGETYNAGVGITLDGNTFNLPQNIDTNSYVQFGSLGVGDAPIPGGLNVSGFINVASPSGTSEITGVNGNLIFDDVVSGDFMLGAGFLNANPATGTLSMAAGGPAFMSYDGSTQITDFNGKLSSDGATFSAGLTFTAGQGYFNVQGNQAPQAYLFQYDYETFVTVTLQGDVVTKGDVIAYASSDKRLKDNIKPIENALQKVESIGGYTFDWNDKQSTYEGSDIGVIAQEIEAIAPELVTERETGYKAVKYDKLVAVLIESVKELSAKVKTLESKLQ